MLYTLIVFLISMARLKAKTRRWRKFAIPTVGTISKLKDVDCIYDRLGQSFSYRHNYIFLINYNNQTFEDVYSEEVLPDKEPTIYLGQRIKILWYECDHTYLQIAETREEKRQLARRVFLETLSLELRTFARKRWVM